MLVKIVFFYTEYVSINVTNHTKKLVFSFKLSKENKYS